MRDNALNESNGRWNIFCGFRRWNRASLPASGKVGEFQLVIPSMASWRTSAGSANGSIRICGPMPFFFTSVGENCEPSIRSGFRFPSHFAFMRLEERPLPPCFLPVFNGAFRQRVTSPRSKRLPLKASQARP